MYKENLNQTYANLSELSLKPQDFRLFSKKYSNLFAGFQKYVYICTKNVTLGRRYSALKRAWLAAGDRNLRERNKEQKV